MYFRVNNRQRLVLTLVIALVAIFAARAQSVPQSIRLSELDGTSWVMENDIDEYTHTTTHITFGKRAYSYTSHWLFKKIRPTQKDEEKTDHLTYEYYLTDAMTKVFDKTKVGKSKIGRYIAYCATDDPNDEVKVWEITSLTPDEMTWTLLYRKHQDQAIGYDGSPIIRVWKKIGEK